jgi:predicted metalloprotease with PDZ domain
MTTISRRTVFALLASLTLTTISTASASQPQALLLNPGPTCYDLPRFGFSSFNINGFGERVTSVRWGGIAQRMGLESGDVILALNGYSLSYSGSWSDALREAMNNGGWVQLTIRDVRTGIVATRETFVGGGYGPIVAHSHVNNYNGPMTYKKTMPFNYSQPNLSGPEQIKKIVEMFDKKNNP